MMDIISVAFPALADAFALILQPQVLFYLATGVVMGLAIGVLPGLGGIAGLSLILPFVFGMDPISGLALMIGMVAVVPTSDTFASVLIGIPGSTASQATVLDGFPLAKRGEAARALSAAFASSLFGGLIGVVFLTFFLLIARPVVLAFGLPEMLMVTLLGMSMIAVLAGRIPVKGIAAAGLGLMLGTIGEADAGGSLRMSSYDFFPYLTDGIKLVIVGLSIFAIPEIVTLLRQGKAISKSATLGAGWKIGIRDWFINKWLSVRCALIGVVVGIIPGLGGSVVDWIAYGHTVQTTKDKSSFGKGEIRGVIGPESSNNAKEGGGLIPTLIFGIPGSGSMAIFIGAVTLLGSGDIEMGPQMLSASYLDITYSIIWLLALANVIGTLLCIGLSTSIARLTTIPFSLLAPFLFMLIAFAAFQSNQSLGDLVALFMLGLLGILMKRFDWSRPAFLIGFVLSEPAEDFSNQAYQVAGFKFQQGIEIGLGYIFSPIVLILIAITLVSVYFGLRQKQAVLSEGESTTRGKRAPLIFLLFVIAYLLVAIVDAASISQRLMTDKFFPITIGVTSLAACLWLFVSMLRKPATDIVFADSEAVAKDENLYELWHILAWFGGLLLGSILIGFIAAIAIFFIAFFRFHARQHWQRTLVLSISGLGFICALAWILNRDFPAGLLQEYIHLPWPLGTDRSWIR